MAVQPRQEHPETDASLLISLRTVEYQWREVFGKLGVTRKELPAALPLSSVPS